MSLFYVAQKFIWHKNNKAEIIFLYFLVLFFKTVLFSFFIKSNHAYKN